MSNNQNYSLAVVCLCAPVELLFLSCVVLSNRQNILSRYKNVVTSSFYPFRHLCKLL